MAMMIQDYTIAVGEVLFKYTFIADASLEAESVNEKKSCYGNNKFNTIPIIQEHIGRWRMDVKSSIQM